MKKLKVTELFALILLCAGIVLIFTCVCIPPFGVIHSSILWTLGQMFTLIGALLGVTAHYGAKIESIENKLSNDK